MCAAHSRFKTAPHGAARLRPNATLGRGGGSSARLLRLGTILVVDDDPSLQSLVRTLLEFEGHVVHLAADGLAALREISEDRPQAMVLDIMIPELDGLGVLQQLGKFGVLDTLPVIVLTADHSFLIGHRCLALGARHVLTKPFDPDELIEVLAALLAVP